VTAQLIVLYTQPDEPEAFDKHYLEVHGPLVDKLPGLERWQTARITAAADGGEASYFRIATLFFADSAVLQAGLGSEAGKATAADYQQIAPRGSRMFIAASD
jgi:uncharacterized protein (TIGR02118 family)